MKRIVIIEGNVSSLSHVIGDKFSVAIDQSDCVPDFRVEIDAEAADVIGASFREPIRVVVEIGAADIAVGSLATATREELIHALAAARHAADEYQRESESLSRRLESLECGTAVFDPRKHIAKATVVEWLDADAASCDRAASNATRDGNNNGAAELRSCAIDTRKIIARINVHKETT